MTCGKTMLQYRIAAVVSCERRDTSVYIDPHSAHFAAIRSHKLRRKTDTEAAAEIEKQPPTGHLTAKPS